jgi:hypothetical protein
MVRVYHTSARLPYKGVIFENHHKVQTLEITMLPKPAAEYISHSISLCYYDVKKANECKVVLLTVPERIRVEPTKAVLYKICDESLVPENPTEKRPILYGGKYEDLNIPFTQIKFMWSLLFLGDKDARIQEEWMTTKFGMQKYDTKLYYNIIATTDVEDMKRCCLPHTAQKWQDEYVYFPCPKDEHQY